MSELRRSINSARLGHAHARPQEPTESRKVIQVGVGHARVGHLMRNPRREVVRPKVEKDAAPHARQPNVQEGVSEQTSHERGRH